MSENKLKLDTVEKLKEAKSLFKKENRYIKAVVNNTFTPKFIQWCEDNGMILLPLMDNWEARNDNLAYEATYPVLDGIATAEYKCLNCKTISVEAFKICPVCEFDGITASDPNLIYKTIDRNGRDKFECLNCGNIHLYAFRKCPDCGFDGKTTSKNLKVVIDHPKHYNMGKYEVIDVIEDWDLGFHLGNALKYIARAKHKENEVRDLRKAIWYIRRKITDIAKENIKKNITDVEQ